MRTLLRSLLFVMASVTGVAIVATPARAQATTASSKGQPTTAFGVGDFAKVRWLEGSWEGTATGEAAIYERFRFVDDSTAEITYYRDPSLTQESGTGKLYLSVGRIYHTFGPNRWGATHAGSDGLYFVPQANARNNFSWDYKTPDTWTATMRTGVSGHERVTVYSMRRIKR